MTERYNGMRRAIRYTLLTLLLTSCTQVRTYRVIHDCDEPGKVTVEVEEPVKQDSGILGTLLEGVISLL